MHARTHVSSVLSEHTVFVGGMGITPHTPSTHHRVCNVWRTV